MTDRKLSALCRATSVVPSKVNLASGHFVTCLLLNPVKDLIGAFVIAAGNCLATVGTVENKHTN